MLRRVLALTVLTVLLSGVAVAPPGHADVVPRDTAVERLEGLSPHPNGTVGARTVETTVTSEQVRTPMPFSMIGFEVPEQMLSGAHDPEHDTTGHDPHHDDAEHAAPVEFRTSADGRSWSAWTAVHVEVDEGPDPGSAEQARSGDRHATRFSVPVWTGEARFLQTRTTSGSTTEVGVELVDATGASRSVVERTMDAVSAAVRPAVAPAVAAPGQPRIVSRAQWGADETIRKGSPSYAPAVRYGVVHHTAATNSSAAADAPALVRGVYAYHVQGRGWSDIGYQFLIDKFGTIYEGRYGGITRAVIGAHAGGFNTESFGASLMGDYSFASPTTAQVTALVDLLAWKAALHGFDPLGTVLRTSAGSSKYAAGTQVRLAVISGHRDVSATTCPAGGYELLGEVRNAVARALGSASPGSGGVQRVGDGSSVSDMLVGLARAAFPEAGSARHAVVARDDVFADALGGGPLAGTDGPILFTPTRSVDPAMRTELARVLPAGRTVYLLGGPAALSPAVEADLGRTWRVVRLGGDNRFETALAVATQVRARSGDERIMVARAGPDHIAPWADALAAGAWGAREGVPILLSPTERLHPVTAGALRAWGSRRSIALGGPDALSPAVVDALPGAVRVAGQDRAGTSAEIARRMWMRTTATAGASVAVADGYRADAWKPALAASPLAARANAPMLLTHPDVLSPAAATYLSGLGHSSANPGTAYAIGTRWRISSAVATEVARHLR